MSEAAATVPTVTIAKKKVSKRTVVIVSLLLLGILAFLLYWFFWPRVDMKKIHELVADQAKGYTDPAAVEHLLLQGVHELRWDRGMYLQAKDYAKSQNLPLEQVLVDSAVSMAKQFGYIG